MESDGDNRNTRGLRDVKIKTFVYVKSNLCVVKFILNLCYFKWEKSNIKILITYVSILVVVLVVYLVKINECFQRVPRKRQLGENGGGQGPLGKDLTVCVP